MYAIIPCLFLCYPTPLSQQRKQRCPSSWVLSQNTWIKPFLMISLLYALYTKVKNLKCKLHSTWHSRIFSIQISNLSQDISEWIDEVEVVGEWQEEKMYLWSRLTVISYCKLPCFNGSHNSVCQKRMCWPRGSWLRTPVSCCGRAKSLSSSVT